jgi:putative cell wall-binding protein
MGRVVSGVLALAVAGAMVAPTTSLAQEERDVRRISGQNRFDTAAAVSADAFDAPVPRVWVATGEAFPDALAAGAAASADSVPVLLTGRAALPEPTHDELQRLRPQQVAVVGGTSAISTDVLREIEEAVPQAQVLRVAGVDRFATAARVAETAFPTPPATVYVATGGSFPDALAAVPAAGEDAAALLLVSRTSVPEPTRTYLRNATPARIVVVGGSAAVSSEVEEELREITDAQIIRVSGVDRFATAVALLERTAATADTRVFVASGETFADALAGGPAAAAVSSAILLTGRDRLPAATGDAITARGFTAVTILGGPAAVSRGVEDTLTGRPSVLTLRGDGLGDGRAFGAPMAEVVDAITERYGAPERDSGWDVYCELAGPEQARSLSWADTLTLTFIDPDSPRFEAYWYRRTQAGADPLALTTPVGIGLSSVSSDVGQRYGERATYHSADSNPFGSFWSVEPAEGGDIVFFVTDDHPSAPVEFIGGNVLFCD